MTEDNERFNDSTLRAVRFVGGESGDRRRWGAMPTYAELVGAFGVHGLRKVKLLTQWLEESALVTVDPTLRRDEPERRQIASLLVAFPDPSSERDLLLQYHGILGERLQAGKTSLRSIRFALSAAYHLLETAREANVMPPNQTIFEHYLLKPPGQRATIGGFVAHLRDTDAATLTMPPAKPKRSAHNNRLALKKEIAALAATWTGDNDTRQQWLMLCLMYLHDMPRKRARRLSQAATSATLTEGEYRVDHDGKIYPVPVEPPSV